MNKDEMKVKSLQVISIFSSSKAGIQHHLVAILCHINKHGEVSLANHFIKGMNDAENVTEANTKAVTGWLAAFGKMTYCNKSKLFTFDSEGETKLNGKGEAKDVKWWAFKPPKVDKGFDLSEEMSKLDKKANKFAIKFGEAIESGDIDTASNINVDVEKLKAVRLIMNGLINPQQVIGLLQPAAQAT